MREIRDFDSGLRVNDVSVQFGDLTAVASATFRVEPGEILALLGPSGCGKSTLLRAIMGLQPYESGGVFWDGNSIDSVPVHERQFGLMFQDGQLFPHRNVARNISYGLKGSGLSRRAQDARVSQMLELVGLPSFAKRQVVHLSGGERQRVALARALAPAPRLLLLDEPLSALDRDLRERLAGDLRSVLQATKTTAIFVTHDHDEAFTVADRVVVMRAGQIEQIGAPHSVWRRPASVAVAKFLGYRWFLAPRGGGDWRLSSGAEPEIMALHSGSFVLESGAMPIHSGAGERIERPAGGPAEAAVGSFAAEFSGQAPQFAGTVTGHLGAYREGSIVAVATRAVGKLEVRVPGERPPRIGDQVVVRVRPDSVGIITGTTH